MTKIPLKIVCDQLTEALGLDEYHKVSALIDEENGDKVCGWAIVKLSDDGAMEPSGKKVKTIKELFEHKEQPDGLDEAAEEYAIQGHENHTSVNYINTYIEGKRIGFIAGAEWMAGQFEKNRLAASDAQTDEEYERETDFVDKIIREKHRTPTFSDAINFGIECERAKMMGKSEVDLEKEMDKLVSLEYVNQPDDEWEMCIARHFYELGLNARKEE